MVFVHPTSPADADHLALGRPRPMLEFIFDTARTVSDLVFSGAISRHPDIRWVFTHGAEPLPLLGRELPGRSRRRACAGGPAGRALEPPVIFPSGAGGLVSTVDDWLAFARMLLAGGTMDGRQVLSTRSSN